MARRKPQRRGLAAQTNPYPDGDVAALHNDNLPAGCEGEAPRNRGPPVSLAALLTTEEVAELLRCSVSILSSWRVHGKGPRFVYVGRAVRYRPADIADYVAAGTRQSTSQGAV